MDPRRGRMARRSAVHPPDQDAGHITQAVAAGDAPSLQVNYVFLGSVSTICQAQPSCASTSLTGRPLLAGTQANEQEEEYYEDEREGQGYAEKEWHEREAGISEEEPELVWKPVEPDEREVSPTRAELRQSGAASSPCSPQLLCAGLDPACAAAVSALQGA